MSDMIGMPCSIEAEQQLLGALMIQNDLADRIGGKIEAGDFFDPVHRAIFEAISNRIAMGSLASPVSLRDDLAGHAGLAELGGAAYLARLAGAAASGHAIRSYAEMVADAAKRRRLIEIADALRSRAINEPMGAAAVIEEAEGRLYALGEGSQEERGPVPIASAFASAAMAAAEAYQRGGGLAGLSTGLIDLDAKLGGLRPSNLLILAGRPSMGKSALAVNVAVNVARTGKRVAIFSLEMSADELAGRIISDIGSLPLAELARGSGTAEQLQKMLEIARDQSSLPIVIDDTPAITIAQLAARARRIKRTGGLDLLVVDYLQLMRGTSRGSVNKVQEIGEISMGLKAVAKDLNIPVIALSQLSRQVESREDKRPMLSDLRESGSIEQDADVVMFVYRDEYYIERAASGAGAKSAEWLDAMDRARGKAEVIIGKQRHGPIGSVELAFQGEFTRFSNLARGEYYGE